MKKNNGCFGSYLALFVVLLMVLGEIQCIVKAIKSDWETVGKREIIYTASFLTGIGSIVGWFNIEDSVERPYKGCKIPG